MTAFGTEIGAPVAADLLAESLTSEDAEDGVLSALLMDVQALPKVRELLEGHMFATTFRANIYLACCELYDTGAPGDVIGVTAYLEQQGALPSGGRSVVSTIADSVPTSGNVLHHAALVRDRWARRVAVQSLRWLEHGVVRGTVTAQAALADAVRAVQAVAPLEHGFRVVRSDLYDVLSGIEQRAASPATALLSTGLWDFDAHYGGVRPGELVVIAGNPGSGKSALLSHVALHLARAGRRVGIESCEMPRTDVIERLLATLAGLDTRALRRGALAEDDWTKLARAAGVLADLPLYVDDANTPTFAAMCAGVEALVLAHGPLDALGVDFVQLLDLGRGASTERVERLKMIAYGLKGLAKAPHPLAVFALAQMNNKDIAKRSDRRPRIEDIQGSSAFEQASDFVLLVSQDEEHSDRLLVDVAKGRGGGKLEFYVRAKWDQMRLTAW